MTVELASWLARGVMLRATHLVVLRNTVDGGTFPIYVMPTQDVVETLDEARRHPLTEVVETYDLSKYPSLEDFEAGKVVW
jgi:hypothetical protein